MDIERLRQLMLEYEAAIGKRLTVPEWSAVFNIQLNTYYRIFRGRGVEPGEGLLLKTVFKLADALGVEPGELLAKRQD